MGKAATNTCPSLCIRCVIVGTPPEIVEQLGALAEAGVQGVMLQWLEVDDIDGLEAFAWSVLSQV